MTSLQKYRNKKIAVYGMGKSGCSTAKVLKKINAKIFCWDDSYKIRKKVKKLNFKFSQFWQKKKDLKIDYIVLSPGINIEKCSIKNYLKKNIEKIITDLDIFFEINKDALIISITGTNGKSTTCKIIEKILKNAGCNAKVGGNIGNPVLNLKKSKRKNIFILEISSYQLQYSKAFRSKYAAILNISPDHLERHKNMKNYVNTKSKIFFSQKRSDFSYINYSNNYYKLLKNIFKKKKLKSKLISVKEKIPTSLLNKINNNYFNSKGNISNLAFAYKIIKKLNISDSIFIKSTKQFKGLAHRQEKIFLNKKITCINDSKATSFESSLQSLSNYDNIYWIVGGLPKQNDNFVLKNVCSRINKAYIIGKHTAHFANQIKKSIPYTISFNLKNAVDNIFSDTRDNKNISTTILFSPAAASFDQFNNFEERGNFFKNLVKKKFRHI